jgi:hypothetical protein
VLNPMFTVVRVPVGVIFMIFDAILASMDAA